MAKNYNNEPLAFMYCNIRGEIKAHRLLHWIEVGRYIKSFREDGTPVTFRIDRIQEYLDGGDARLLNPIQEAPPRIEPRKPRDMRPQVVFTGFPQAVRAELEAASDAAGLNVVKSVTKNLTFLCGGYNAGPLKLEKAREQGVYILDEQQLRWLLETGELPDSDHDGSDDRTH